jgi:probable F420-dependent oxidoreductase
MPMKFGIAFFATDTSLDPISMARECEARGFESLWLPEHSHIPVSRETPWGGTPDAPPLPEHYWRTFDTVVALAAAAAVTTELRLATGITLLAQRDPIWTAKEVASLDVLSGGRFTLGVGYGWNKEELRSHGVKYSERRALVREKLLTMKALWTEDEASYEGEHVKLEPSWAWPKPVQKPHPPIVLGGALGPRTIADIVELCDGWMPLGRYEIADSTAEIREALTDAGRDPDAFELTYFGAKPDEALVTKLAEHGFRRVLLSVPSKSPEQVIETLDELAEFAASFAH